MLEVSAEISDPLELESIRSEITRLLRNRKEVLNQAASSYTRYLRAQGDLDIALIDSRTGRHVGRVLHTKYRGNGVKLFNDGGRFKLRIDSTLARWELKIIQIKTARPITSHIDDPGWC